MGWGDCGTDSRGRPIGYGYEGTCDEPGCEIEIDRGLAYACGDMHGENGSDCEGYFCDAHRCCMIDTGTTEGWIHVCHGCMTLHRAEPCSAECCAD